MRSLISGADPGGAMSEDPAAEDLGGLVARMAGAPAAADQRSRVNDLGSLGRALAGSARRAGRSSVLS
ncbi:MAG TPA: hypothetical protein DIW80_03460, partial [Gordonia polyisoprenivorans]|nr:hypothetical protein [Gordonia polyisoprenivorans]